jgi:hypothetical protein
LKNCLKLHHKRETAHRLATMRRATRTRETDVQSPYESYLDQQAITDATDRIRVVHSYRVATSAKLEDGRYVCTAWDGDSQSSGVVVVDRPFARATLPIVWWSPYPSECGGLIGVGLGAQLVEQQRALDFAMGRLQQRVERLGWAKVLLPSSVPQSVEDNLKAEEIATVKIPQMEGPPVVMENQALGQHDIQWIELLDAWSGGDMGINDAIARGGSGRAPTASGVAMFEELERQIGRISDIYEAWQQFTLRLGGETIGAIEDAVRYDASFASTYRGPDGDPLRYDWADKTLPTAEYVLEIEQAGAYARTRAGRLAWLQEGGRSGIFQPDEAAAAIRSDPNVRRLAAGANAPRAKIERDLSVLCDPRGKHDDVVVTRDDDLALAVRLASERIAEAASRRAKPETLLRLRNYRRAAEAELELIRAEQLPPAGAPALEFGPAGAPADPALDADLAMAQ